MRIWALMAHLLRRAGFGASREELEAYAAKGYDEVVEDLVDEERCPPIDEDIIKRYFGGEGAGDPLRYLDLPHDQQPAPA